MHFLALFWMTMFGRIPGNVQFISQSTSHCRKSLFWPHPSPSVPYRVTRPNGINISLSSLILPNFHTPQDLKNSWFAYTLFESIINRAGNVRTIKGLPPFSWSPCNCYIPFEMKSNLLLHKSLLLNRQGMCGQKHASSEKLYFGFVCLQPQCKVKQTFSPKWFCIIEGQNPIKNLSSLVMHGITFLLWDKACHLILDFVYPWWWSQVDLSIVFFCTCMKNH